jgi:hypothetical protein
MMRLLRIFGCAIAVAIVLVPSATAMASLFVVLDPEEGAPGIVVTGRTGGTRAFGQQSAGLPAFLVPSAVVPGLEDTVPDEAALTANPGLTPVGQLEVDPEGNGSIRFRVPEVRPGTYQLFLLCESCARFSAGRTFIPVADFRVTDPEGRYRRETGPWPLIVAGMMAGLLVLAASWERTRR